MNGRLVNIYNEGMIPWLFLEGPIFGYVASPGLLAILQKDPRLKFEFTTPEGAEEAKRQYLASKVKTPVVGEKFKITDDLVITPVAKEEEDNTIVEESISNEVIEEAVVADIPEDIGTIEEREFATDAILPEMEYDELDAAIDGMLEDVPMISEIPVHLEDTTEEAAPVKKYKKAKLVGMTKAELKAILRERGYVQGPYAGKYHDTHSMLVDKVLKTQ